MSKSKKPSEYEILGELDNLRRELEYYIVYEPENEKGALNIEKRINKLNKQLQKIPNKHEPIR